MASDTDFNLGPAANITGSTSNPQSIGQDSTIAGKPQTLQNASSSASINNQSTGLAIQLPPVNIRTSAVHISPGSNDTTHHKLSAGGLVIVAFILVMAIGIGVYIYLSNKKYLKSV